MLHKISHKNYSAKISVLGAELKSFRDDSRSDEYIWQGNPDIWKGSAPILFPIIGRLKDGKYKYNKKTYQLAKHGFARTSTFALSYDTESEKHFMLTSNPDTQASYPFEFEFIAGFTISEGKLSVSYTVKNKEDEKMYFTLGSHPAFSLPTGDCALEDFYIEFEKNEILDCYFLENDLLTAAPIKSYLNNENKIKISKDLFNNDALIFKNIKSRKIAIKNKKTGHRITLHTGNAPHLGIWAKPGAPYVCLEPWYSHDDSIDSDYDLTKKLGMMKLEAGENFKTGYEILV